MSRKVEEVLRVNKKQLRSYIHDGIAEEALARKLQDLHNRPQSARTAEA